MIFRTLATTAMALVFSTSMSFNFFQISSTQGEYIFNVSNQSLTLFMPTETLIISEVATSNDENC